MSRQRRHGAVEDLEYNNSPTLPKTANQEATKRYRSSKYILIGRNICIFQRIQAAQQVPPLQVFSANIVGCSLLYKLGIAFCIKYDCMSNI